jgi:hypothetical protein
MSVYIEFGVTKPQDLTRIDHTKITELLWWSYYFGVCPERLLSLIHKFGNNAAEIEKQIWAHDIVMHQR